MKFVIKHEIRGRIRVHLIGKAMSFAQADTLQCNGGQGTGTYYGRYDLLYRKP